MIGRPEGARILVAGVGNIFLGDDAFGVEVAQRMARRPQPEGVRVVDFGIRGLDLAYALLDGYEAVIIVDAMPRGQPPGTLFVLEPDTNLAATHGASLVETHNMDPVQVLRLASSLGGQVKRLLIVGCEPESCGSDDVMPAGLSAPVRAAVDAAVPLVESLAARLLRGQKVSAAAAVP